MVMAGDVNNIAGSRTKSPLSLEILVRATSFRRAQIYGPLTLFRGHTMSYTVIQFLRPSTLSSYT